MGTGTEGVSDIETGGEQQKAPSTEELQAQLQALQEENAARAKREEQYLAALASVDTMVQQRQPAPRREATGEEDDEQLDPVMEKKLAKLREADERRWSSVQDQMDQMAFGQMAATMGISQEDYVEVEKQFASFRANGVAIVDATGAKRGLTRTDVLDRIIAMRARGEMMKTAPQKNLESLRGKIIGQASFDPVGSYEGAPKLVKLDADLDAEPVQKRNSKLQKTLENIEF